MNNYDDKEIEVMSDEEIKQFVGILGKMLKSAQTKELTAKVELDQRKSTGFMIAQSG